jgi:ABC-type Mn2+/Zn2+ transport system permease subunit
MPLTDPNLRAALLTAAALATACSVLSIPVVLRRWAFIGEGIGHSAFGGAGVAWVLALVFPSLENEWAPYAFVVAFCLLTALAIGALSRDERLPADTAIGIFLVASLAWGFVAQQIYAHHRHGATPAWFDDLLFGQMRHVTTRSSLAAAALCAGVVLTVAMLAKEIAAYCFDPLTARTSGVRADFIHYLLMLLIAVVIVLGVRIAGSVLVTALLVLPGATALLLSRRLALVVAISVTSSLLAAIAGLFINARWPYLPVGPAIVLTLITEFAIAYTLSRPRIA